MSEAFLNTVVVGAGAVGSFYGAMLARAGKRVTLLGRAAHVEAIRREGLRLLMAGGEQRIALAASTDLAAVSDADLVLFCVKSTDTAATARAIAPQLKADALVLCMQNGVDNAPHLLEILPNPVLAAAVYVAVAMPEPGVVQHFGRGDLLVGWARPAEPEALAAQRLAALVAHFETGGIKVEVSPKVMSELWNKLLANCAFNAISGLTQLPYGVMAALPDIREVQELVVREVVAVAQAEGQALEVDAGMAAVDRIAASMPGQLSSTAQDMARGKPSEIDHLNGYVARRGAELGLATPVNQTLWALVKLAEFGRKMKTGGS